VAGEEDDALSQIERVLAWTASTRTFKESALSVYVGIVSSTSHTYKSAHSLANVISQGTGSFICMLVQWLS
jgi:hypothetical protein